MRVTVLATGTVGIGMAHPLQRAGHALTDWKRDSDRAAPLADVGATAALISLALSEAVSA